MRCERGYFIPVIQALHIMPHEMMKKVNNSEFLREFLIENNFVTLPPYLGYHINLTRAGSATKKKLICTHHEKAHTRKYIFCVEL